MIEKTNVVTVTSITVLFCFIVVLVGLQIYNEVSAQVAELSQKCRACLCENNLSVDEHGYPEDRSEEKQQLCPVCYPSILNCVSGLCPATPDGDLK